MDFLALAKEIEELGDDEACKLAKKYLRKLVGNFREKKELVDEVG